MKKPVASIFIAMLAVATGAGAQGANQSPQPHLVSHQPVAATATQGGVGGVQPAVGAAVQPRATRDSATLTPTERARVEQQGGQPLLWLKTMAAAHEANQANNQARKPQVAGVADKKSQAKSR